MKVFVVVTKVTVMAVMTTTMVMTVMINGGDGSYDDESGYRGNGGNDEETHGVGESQRGGAMSWDSNYYATQDTNHGG